MTFNFNTLSFIFCLAAVSISCTETVSTSDIIQSVTATPETAVADGSSIISLSATLNNDLDQRSVLFKVDNGSFVDNKNADSIIVTAEKINQQLTAVARLQCPVSPGKITVKVQMAIVDQKGRFVVVKELNISQSAAAAITLTGDAFSVYNNFDGEITLTGTLTNSQNKGVSKGSKVQIEDVNSSYAPVNGKFRNSKLTSNDASQVSTVYSPGFISPGQSIFLIATILDSNGHKTKLTDTLSIAVIQKH